MLLTSYLEKYTESEYKNQKTQLYLASRKNEIRNFGPDNFGHPSPRMLDQGDQALLVFGFFRRVIVEFLQYA